MSIEAIKQALTIFKNIRLHPDMSVREYNEYCKALTTIAECEARATEQAEKRSCKYPKCPYPCPDLPDCKDSEDLYDLAVKADNGGQP